MDLKNMRGMPPQPGLRIHKLISKEKAVKYKTAVIIDSIGGEHPRRGLVAAPSSIVVEFR